MRIGFVIAGLILTVVGAAAASGKLEYTREREVVKIGELSAKVEEDRRLPQWIGGLGIIAGIGLIAMGALKR